MNAAELFERDVDIALDQPPEYLARQLVLARRQMDFVREQFPDIMQFCRSGGCGHLLQVHDAEGCNGVIAGGNHWSMPDRSCSCAQWQSDGAS